MSYSSWSRSTGSGQESLALPGLPTVGLVSALDVGLLLNGTDESGRANAVLPALTAAGLGLAIPAGRRLTLASPLTPPAGAIITGGRGAEIAQTVVNTPAIDNTADTVTVTGLHILNTQARAYLATSFRGSAGYVYSAGIWSSGNHCTFRNLSVSGFTSGVYLTSWNGVDFTKAKQANAITGLSVDDVDFGILATGQDDPVVVGVSGSYSLTPSSPNPPHLIYWSEGHPSSGLDVSGCTARAGTGGHAYQFKGIAGGIVRGLQAYDCPGLLSVRGCADVDFSSMVSDGDTGGVSGNGSLYIQATGGENRLRIRSVIITMVAAARVARLDGSDCVIDGLTVNAYRPSPTDNSHDITVQGTRNLISGLVYRNSQAGTGGASAITVVSGGTDNIIRDVAITGTRYGVRIEAGATNTRLDIDQNQITLSPAASGPARVVDNGTGTTTR